MLLSGCDGVMWQANSPDTFTDMTKQVSTTKCTDNIEERCRVKETEIDKISSKEKFIVSQINVLSTKTSIIEHPQTISIDNDSTLSQDWNSNEETGVVEISPGHEHSLTELSQQALYESDDKKRIDATYALTHYRNNKATETLLQAASDPALTIRYYAIQTLGYAAADGLDIDGRITAVLQQAILDYDPRIAQLAKQSLNKLKKNYEDNFIIKK